MSEFRVDTLELEAFVAQLEHAAKDVSLAARGVSNKYAGKIVKEARRRVPVRTGRLKDSIHVTPLSAARSVAAAGVAADAPYAGFVEFGTSRMGPRPFLRPAFDKYRKEFIEELADVGAEMLGEKGKARSALRSQRERFSLEQQLVAGSFRP